MLGLKYVVVVDYESGEIIPFHVAAQRKPFQIRQPMGVVYRYNDDVTRLQADFDRNAYEGVMEIVRNRARPVVVWNAHFLARLSLLLQYGHLSQLNCYHSIFSIAFSLQVTQQQGQRLQSQKIPTRG